jgi:hypothetical protein
MYQESGRAVLGWKASLSATAFKDVFTRGASGSFSSEEAGRLKKAVADLLPGTSFVRWYTGSTAEALMLRAGAFGRRQPGEACCAADGKNAHAAVLSCADPVLWYPWKQAVSGVPGADTAAAYLFLPPFPLAYDTVIRAARADSGFGKAQAPSSDMLPPCILAGITRSIRDLIAEIPRRSESGWAVYDDILGQFWTREGPYLYPKMPRERYAAFAQLCLDSGLVISPDYDIPSLIPFNADRGVFAELCSKMK